MQKLHELQGRLNPRVQALESELRQTVVSSRSSSVRVSDEEGRATLVSEGSALRPSENGGATCAAPAARPNWRSRISTCCAATGSAAARCVSGWRMPSRRSATSARPEAARAYFRDKPDHEQQDHRARHRADQRRRQAAADVQAQHPEQVAADDEAPRMPTTMLPIRPNPRFMISPPATRPHHPPTTQPRDFPHPCPSPPAVTHTKMPARPRNRV